MPAESEELQIEEENLWAIVDSDGEVVKGGFDNEEDARAWMDTEEGKKVLAKKGSSSYDVEPQTGLELPAEDADDEETEA